VDIGSNGPDQYVLTYTWDEDGCLTTAETTVTFNLPPVATVDIEGPECAGDELGTVLVSVEGGIPDYSFALDGGDYQTEPSFDNIPLGNFQVTVRDANGCESSIIEVMEDTSPDPILDIMGGDFIFEGDDVPFSIDISQIAPQDVKNIRWIYEGEVLCEGPDCYDSTIPNISASGEIFAEVEYGTSCIVSSSREFSINGIQRVYIPNMVDYSGRSFAPDDQWIAYIKGDDTFIQSVKVFDRWGNLVKDYENKSLDYYTEFLIWDGFYGSEPAEQGVYTYVITLLIEGQVRPKFGSVTVLR